MDRALKVLAFSISWAMALAQNAVGQAPIRVQEAAGPRVQTATGQALPLAWAGGFNSPQFSPIDLNQDGQEDLFVFDRSSQRVVTFLAVQTNGVWGYQAAPQYAEAFPKDLRFFALLRDFNCDGKPDIFTASNEGIRVYTNTNSAAGLSFSLSYPVLFYGANINLLVGSEDLPAIVDMDGDGDLDIISWEWSGGTQLEYFRNNQVELGLACGNLSFTKASGWWGQVTRCIGKCNSYVFNQTCPSIHHIGGSSVLPLDLDGNGVLDLLSGHDDCPDLVSLFNTGTNLQPKITSAAYNLPPDIVGNQFSVFPGAFYLDVTFDGIPDLVVAPNATSNSHQNVNLKNSVWFIKNTGTAAKPKFNSPKQPFLQDQMLDVGEGAAPALANLVGNSALDLLVGNTAVLENGRYAASLTLYQNKGTAQRAIFEVLDTDYLGFSARKLLSLKPQVVDLNNDGSPDLVWSAYNPATAAMEFKYLLNQAAAGQPAQFAMQNAVAVPGVLLFRGDTPYLYDVNADGKLDVLVGKSSGALAYYQNAGTNTAPVYTLVSEALGGLGPNLERRRLQVAVTDLNQDQQPDLLTSDDSGQLRVYPNFRANVGGTFMPFEEVLWQPYTKQYSKADLGPGLIVAAADLDQAPDQLPELLIGTHAGGLRFFKAILNPADNEPDPNAKVLLYPNPAQNYTLLITPQEATYTLFSITGVAVAQGKTSANQATLITTRYLPAAIYVLRLVPTNGKASSHKLIVQH